jgi:hypothetical protein
MFCPSCGKEVRAGASFCEGCGQGVAPGASLGEPSPFPNEGDVVCFVGEMSGYYLDKFRKFQAGRVETFAPTWNWSAFCFTTGWFLYRKMYLWTLLFFVASCIPVLGLVAWLAAGLAGNYLYYRHVSGRIAEARSVTPEHELPAVLSQLGGVHRWVIWVGIGIVVLALLAIVAAISIPLLMNGSSGGVRAI